jgi:hypothetical protein
MATDLDIKTINITDTEEMKEQDEDDSFFGGSKKVKAIRKPAPAIVIKEDAESVSDEAEDAAAKSEVEIDVGDSASEVDTVTMLSRDPLFLVMSKYFANDRGNIVDILEKINANLERMVMAFQKP